MRIHYLQHVPFENLANIENWAGSKGYVLSKTLLYEGAELPDLDCFDLLIILGGPMNIYEEDKYNWLKQEKAFIKEVINRNKPVLGICLGSQLIADVLGAKVYANNHKEIGWFPLKLFPASTNMGLFNGIPEEFPVFHWHGDTFDLPENSTLIASSEGCKNQGFIYNGKVIGLQFHLETSRTAAENLISNCGDELVDGKYIQSAEIMLNYSGFDRLEQIMTLFLDNFEKIIRK